MSISRISTRYAKSLLDLAIDRKELESVVKDMEYFNAVVKSNKDFYLLIKSPIVSSSKKLNIFKAIFQDKIGVTCAAFFDIIVKKGREMYLPEIAADFLTQYKIYNHVSSVTITTASPLSETSLNEIKTKLLASAITMDKLDITTKIDPELIGGFVIEVGDRLYDASVAYKLDQYKKGFLGNQYVKSF